MKVHKYIYRSVPQIRLPSRISPPCLFSAKSCWGIFILHISSPTQKKTHTLPTVGCWLSTIEVSTVNTDRPHQQWTCQLLCGSTLLPHSSTLELVSLPLASSASLRLAFSDALHLVPTPTDNDFMPGREGVIAREIVASNVYISLPCILY